jgi:hypothetical protein
MARLETEVAGGELGVSGGYVGGVGQDHRDDPHLGETASIAFSHLEVEIVAEGVVPGRRTRRTAGIFRSQITDEAPAWITRPRALQSPILPPLHHLPRHSVDPL